MTALPINLPDGFSSSVKVGDKVTVGQTIASQSTFDEEIINIPKELSIKKSLVKKFLKKSPGEGIKVGDLIAEKKSLFGSGIRITSSVEGTVARYERDTGDLVIKKSKKSVFSNIISPVDGIVAICNNNQIVINADKNVLIGNNAAGVNGQGVVFILKKDDPYFLDSSTIGKIVVGESFTREMLLKGIGIGVLGIVGENINDIDIDYLNEKKFKIPVIKLDNKNLKTIIEWNAKKVFLNPELKSIIFLSL